MAVCDAAVRLPALSLCTYFLVGDSHRSYRADNVTDILAGKDDLPT